MWLCYWCVVIIFDVHYQAPYNGQMEKSMILHTQYLFKNNVPEYMIFFFLFLGFKLCGEKKLENYNKLFNYLLARRTSKEERHTAAFTKGEIGLWCSSKLFFWMVHFLMFKSLRSQSISYGLNNLLLKPDLSKAHKSVLSLF